MTALNYAKEYSQALAQAFPYALLEHYTILLTMVDINGLEQRQ